MYVIKFPKELTRFVKAFLSEKGKIVKSSEGAILYDGEYVDIPEITRVFKVYKVCNANINEILRVSRDIKLENCRFAVRTEKRGNKIRESSLEINRIVGEIILKNSRNCRVDLENPDIVIAVEIFDDLCAICLVKGKEYQYKKYVGKELVLDILKRIKIAQMVYTGEGSCKMGERIGRAAQAFEIKELILFLHKKMDGKDVLDFLKGVFDGIRSRYEIERKIYNREVKKVKVSVWDIYHYILEERERETFIIITDPRGKSFEEVKDNIRQALKDKKDILFVNGANEGVPVGIFRYADVVVDLAPGITFATEHTIPIEIFYLISTYKEIKGSSSQS